MSRIGKKPIEIPSGVTVKLDGTEISVKGPKGQLQRELPPNVKVDVGEKEIVVMPGGEGRRFGAFQGLTRSLLANMVHGVTTGFEKKMQVVGVGYKVMFDGKKLVLNLGYSHPVEYPLPPGIDAEVGEKGLNFIIKGIDRELVGLTCAKIRDCRPPEPYKGKGVRYANEVVRQKAGKAGSK